VSFEHDLNDLNEQSYFLKLK